MAEKLNGVWKVDHTDNFDNYLKELGVNFALRNMARLARPTVTIKIEDNSVHLRNVSTFKTIDTKCIVDEEWDEATTDGRKCKSKMWWDGGVLVHVQKWDGRETTIRRFVDEDGNYIVICDMGGVTSKSVYKRVND